MALKSIRFLGQKVFVKQELIHLLVKGKSVVHYGCVDDDLDLIESKIKKGYYLHKLLSESTSACIGIDINRELIPIVHEKFNLKNIVYGDVENPETFEMDTETLKEYEILLIPDLIEHLNNVGKMLEAISIYYSPDVKIIIVTPNPNGYLNFAATLMRKELYTDHHTCLFSSHCMKIILNRYNIVIDKVTPVFVPKERNWFLVMFDKIVGKLFTFISPGFADLYMYECSLSGQQT